MFSEAHEAAAWDVLDGPFAQVRADLERLAKLGSVTAVQFLNEIDEMTEVEFSAWVKEES